MATRHKPTGEYRGELRRPINLPNPNKRQRRVNPRTVFVLTPESEAREAVTIERAVAEKLPALFAHFSIQEDDPDRWQQLALALAHKHVKGFQVVHSTGAPVVKSVELLCRLYRYFIRTKADRRQRKRSQTVTDAEICKTLSNDEDFKRAFPELKSPSPKRLQNLVVEAKERRRGYLEWFVQFAAYKRSLGPEESVDPMLQGGEPPIWFSDRPVVFGKLDKSGPPRRREK
jgi:hypothetical protein